MALDGRELTFSVQQSYPGAGAITQDATGTWPNGDYSLKVAAWYTSGEGQQDNAGFIRIDVTLWHCKVTSGANDAIIITWTASARVPDHYSIYCIKNATWTANGVLRGRKIAEVDGDILTATILKPFLQQGSSTNMASTTTSEDGASPTTVLHDTTASFSTNGVKAGDSISNVTDASTSTVVTVDSDIKLTTTALSGGTDDKFESGDSYRVTSTTLLEDTAATFVSNGVEAGHYVILNAGASTAGAYAVVTDVISETVLTTAALTDDSVYTLADSYDVVYNILVATTAATSFTINPVLDIPFKLREAIVPAYNGVGVTKSYAKASPVDDSRFEFNTISITEANYKVACRWIGQGVRIRVTESTNASALIPIRDGYFTGASHLPTRFKSTRQTYWLDFYDETGTIT